jgi:phage portal protein BeeE
MVSLNVNIMNEDAGPTELLQTISDREVDRRLGRERTLSEEQLNDLKSDMGNVIKRLPKRLQDFLELKKTLSLNEIVNELGVPRSTLGDWMNEIRVHFEEAGLEKYFLK